MVPRLVCECASRWQYHGPSRTAARRLSRGQGRKLLGRRERNPSRRIGRARLRPAGARFAHGFPRRADPKRSGVEVNARAVCTGPCQGHVFLQIPLPIDPRSISIVAMNKVCLCPILAAGMICVAFRRGLRPALRQFWRHGTRGRLAARHPNLKWEPTLWTQATFMPSLALPDQPHPRFHER